MTDDGAPISPRLSCHPQPPVPSSDRSPATHLWLSEDSKEEPWSPTARLINQMKYSAFKKKQLSRIQELVSRRETSSPGQFPFLCVFKYVGCDQKFENSREWKDHMVSRHLGRIFWECTKGDCARAKCLVNSTTTLPSQSDCPEDWTLELPQDTYSGKLFENKDDFRTHLYKDHLSDAPKDAYKDTDKYTEWLLCLQDSSMRTFSGLPQSLGCPMPKCEAMHFLGPGAWDLRLNHAAKHFLADPQCPEVFGGDKDQELMQWASSGKVDVQEKSPVIAWYNRPCVVPKSVADSGYGSMQGTGPPNMAQHTSILPVNHESLKTIPESPPPVPLPKSKLRCLRPGPGWRVPFVSDNQDSSTQPSIPDDSFSASNTYRGKSPVTSSLDTSVVDSEEEADETASVAQENAAVMGWFRVWLREWLTPLTRPQGNQCGTDQTTSTHSTSQGQNSGSSSNTGTQKERRVPQHYSEPKRKRNGEEEDDGSEESSKTQCSNGPSSLQRFACPFYKRNPRKYGQPKWKSCAHPGYKGVRRVKEHMYRRHLLPQYQCPRCYSDLKTWVALQTHSQQEIACTRRVGVFQDGINQDQEKYLRDKKRTAKQKTEVAKWKDAYAIAFPHDGDIPSPYLYDTNQDNSKSELSLCQELGRYLLRDLPPLVARDLAARELPSFVTRDPATRLDPIQADTIRQAEVMQSLRIFVPQLITSFLEEIGHSTSEQPDNGSADDGNSVMEASATGSGSEELGATFPVGSTAEESMTIFPADNELGESTADLPLDNAPENPATMLTQEWDIDELLSFPSLDPSFIFGQVQAM